MKVKQDFNSTKNQEIKRKFIDIHVYTCFSYEMDSILKASCETSGSGLPTYDDIENMYEDVCQFCGETREYDDRSGGEHCACGGDFESQPQEVFEWWIVDRFLYKQLKKRGHVVLEWGNNYYWGRCTTGQAILLDSVISDICNEMEILDGQKYSWSK